MRDIRLHAKGVLYTTISLLVAFALWNATLDDRAGLAFVVALGGFIIPFVLLDGTGGKTQPMKSENPTNSSEQPADDTVCSGSDREPMDYGDLKSLLKSNIGTIIRDVDNRDERVRFSTTDYPEVHSTLIEAAVWHTTETSTPKYTAFVLRSLESSTGRSAISDGNRYFDSYSEAVKWVESKGEEHDGEPLNWRDLPRKPVHCDGEPYVYLGGGES